MNETEGLNVSFYLKLTQHYPRKLGLDKCWKIVDTIPMPIDAKRKYIGYPTFYFEMRTEQLL